MARTAAQIAETWTARAEAIRTLPAEQAVHHVADFGQYIAAAFSAASTRPTRDKLDTLLAHLEGASAALQALRGRMPESGTPEASTGPIPRMRVSRQHALHALRR